MSVRDKSETSSFLLDSRETSFRVSSTIVLVYAFLIFAYEDISSSTVIGKPEV